MKITISTSDTTVRFGDLYKVNMKGVEIELDLAQLPKLVEFAQKLQTELEAPHSDPRSFV